ncbi:hypothetical protein ACFWV1_18760 [Streptomyces sp. NPDC058700]|uniref:hypothetical protein n=1 Tax=Streptomyces sp. NPDC058700 TaxID=3346607 RepID=UPI003654F37E
MPRAGGAAPASTAPASPEPTATSGQELATYPSGSRPHLVSDGRTLAVFDSPAGGGHQLDLFDLRSGRKTNTLDLETSDQWKNACALALVPQEHGGHSLIVSTSVVARPAEGIHPARGTLSLRAHDAVTGSLMWKKDVEKDSTQWGSSCEGATTTELALSATSDGTYALLAPGLRTYLVRLDDGTARQVPEATVVLDRWLGLPRGNSSRIGAVSVDIQAPATGRKLGSVPEPVTAGSEELGRTEAHRGILIALDSEDAQGENAMRGYSLPSGKPVWSLRHSATGHDDWVTMDLDAATGTAIVYDNGGGSLGALAAVDVVSGKLRWKIDGSDDFCGIADGRVYLRVNDQSAVLDARTKRQVRFDAQDTDCPEVLPGVLMYTDDDQQDTTDTYRYRIATP